jgi:RNA polymerase sigma-70 factor (ECF subfamily)
MALEWAIPEAQGARRWAALRLAMATTPRSTGQPAASDADRAASEDAFEVFFWRHERRIFGYLWRMTGDEQGAHDLAQETFLRAWRHFAELHDAAHAGPWLVRVASNLALNYLRRRNERPPLAPLDDNDPGASDPGRGVAEREAVRSALAVLTPKQRGALILHEVYGLTCDEVGQALGITRDAVKMALLRGRLSFRAHYLRENDR